MVAISGYLKDEKELSTVPSGGLGTSIASYIIKHGGIVYGVKYSPDFKSACYMRVENADELCFLKGSKYIRASKVLENGMNVFQSVMNDLQMENRKILFIGLPCEVAALYKFLQRKKAQFEQLFTIDLICHGPTYNGVQEQFVEMLEKQYHSKVISFNTRFKNPDWTPPYLCVDFENGERYIKKLYESEFGIAFDIIPQQSCYACKYKGENHVADITIGDYWGCQQDDKSYNRLGVSVGFIRRKEIEELVCDLDFFVFNCIDGENARYNNPRYDTPVKKCKNTDKFMKSFKEKGLCYAVNHRYTFLDKIKILIKRIIKMD